MTVQRSASSGRRSPGDEQADLERSAEYDDRLAVQDAAAAAAPAPAAATPPAAAGFARLAPTEATYVQAWMKANAARR
jgi:hypothetical protein